MAKQHTKQIQPSQVLDQVGGEVVEQENITPEEVIRRAAQELVAAFEMECEAAHSAARGQALPYADITWAVDTLFDAVGVDKGAIKVLADKAPKLLAVKYAQMGTSTGLVTVKVGSKMVTMANDQLRSLRESQLAHMKDPKTKDNFYRRIYGLGFRKEFKRFELRDGDLVRKAKSLTTTEDNPQE